MTYPKFHYDIKIREFHLDSFGHVNNATYLQIFEEARWELVTANGYGLKEVHARKQGPVILEVKLEFLKEMKLREDIRITSYLTSYEGKIGYLIQEMWRGDELCCRMNMKFALFDVKERKIIPPTPEWLKAVGAVL